MLFTCTYAKSWDEIPVNESAIFLNKIDDNYYLYGSNNLLLKSDNLENWTDALPNGFNPKGKFTSMIKYNNVTYSLAFVLDATVYSELYANNGAEFQKVKEYNNPIPLFVSLLDTSIYLSGMNLNQTPALGDITLSDYSYNSFNIASGASGSITNVVKTKDNLVWAASSSGNIYLKEGTDFVNQFTTNQSARLCSVSSGEAFIYSNPGILSRYNSETQNWEAIEINKEMSVKEILEINSNKCIIIANNKNNTAELYFLNLSDNSLEYIHSFDNKANSGIISNGMISVLCQGIIYRTSIASLLSDVKDDLMNDNFRILGSSIEIPEYFSGSRYQVNVYDIDGKLVKTYSDDSNVFDSAKFKQESNVLIVELATETKIKRFKLINGKISIIK